MGIRTPILLGAVVILVLMLVVQWIVWQEAHKAEGQLKAEVSRYDSIFQEHQRLTTTLAQQRRQLQALESTALWARPHHELLPQLGEVSRSLGVDLVGLDELPVKQASGYALLSKRLTFTGAYAGFAKLLAALEAIEPVIRLDEVRIYERPRIPDVLWLSLVVTPMYQEGKGSKSPMPRALELPEVEIDRNPFAFADSERPAPLQAVVVPSAAAPLPTLTGIIWDSGDPIAVFTDHLQRAHLAHRNEVVVDAKVVDIQPRHVVLEYEGEQHTLSLLDEPPSDRSPGATLPNAPTSVRANLLGRRSRD